MSDISKLVQLTADEARSHVLNPDTDTYDYYIDHRDYYVDHRNFVMCTNYKNAFGFDGDTDDFSRKVALFEVRQLHLVRMRASPSPRTHTPTPRAASDPSCKSANPSK